MTAVEHDKTDGKVIAYVDYQIVDSFGHLSELGQYCWVNECWVHKDFRKRKILNWFVEREHLKWPTVKWLYYKRRKYGDRIRQYDIMEFYTKEK